MVLRGAQRYASRVRVFEIKNVRYSHFSITLVSDRSVSLSIDVSSSGTHALVAKAGGFACLVNLHSKQGVVERVYSNKDTELRPSGGFGAAFAAVGQGVLFGSVEGCALVWDTKSGGLVYGLEHPEGANVVLLRNFN